MDYKKKYKEALEIVKAYYNRTCFSSIINSQEEKETLERAFPELKESGDEKIPKLLHELLCAEVTAGQFEKHGLTVDDALYWIEKQKEHKVVQDEIEREYIRTLHSLISDFLRDKGDDVVDREYYQQIYDWLEGRHIEQKPAEWSEEDEKNLEKCISHMINIIPVPGKHGLEDMSFEKHIDEELVTWLNLLPKRFNLQPKQEWSEEDERMIREIDESLVLFKIGQSDEGKKEIEKERLWLKSLRLIIKIVGVEFERGFLAGQGSIKH